MKKLLGILVALLLVVPAALAVNVGSGLGIGMETESFDPLIWLCDSRVLNDDNVEPARDGSTDLSVREHNYAFEGEQISWTVLVMDKNKIEEIDDVVVTLGDVQAPGNDIEVECKLMNAQPDVILDTCNARILEEDLTGEYRDPDTQAYYECTLTVETPTPMYDEYFISIEAIPGAEALARGEQAAIIDEAEYWFLNPNLALSIVGNIDFGIVRPGTHSYSSTLLLGNDADLGSGVMMEMFISGTDFYDPMSVGAACPNTNQLALNGVGPDGFLGSLAFPADGADDTGIRYYATSGAYDTCANGINIDKELLIGDVTPDAECYDQIPYGDNIRDSQEIIGGEDFDTFVTSYDPGNVLSPGSEQAITFKLILPEPCVGDFIDGQLYFWGEAV